MKLAGDGKALLRIIRRSDQDNEAVPQPYLIRASDGNVYQISWNLIHPGPEKFLILNESGVPVVPDENVAAELYLALLRWDKLPVSIRSNVRSLKVYRPLLSR